MVMLASTALTVGNYITDNLRGSVSVAEIRGRGLMIGIELKEGFEKIKERLLFQKCVFTGSAGRSVIRVLPPLNISIKEADEFISAFRELEKEMQ